MCYILSHSFVKKGKFIMSEMEEIRQGFRALAKAIWREEAGATLPKDPKERNEAFQTVKPDLMLRARKMGKILDRLGYRIAPKA